LRSNCSDGKRAHSSGRRTCIAAVLTVASGLRGGFVVAIEEFTVAVVHTVTLGLRGAYSSNSGTSEPCVAMW
jgi:hypothetical protein